MLRNLTQPNLNLSLHKLKNKLSYLHNLKKKQKIVSSAETPLIRCEPQLDLIYLSQIMLFGFAML